MRQIGIDLPFPDDLYLLGDKIYPNRHPIMTPYTRQQIARKPANLQQKCRKMNRLITEYRVQVEHAIGDLKRYKILSTIWRHKRQHLNQLQKYVLHLFVDEATYLINKIFIHKVYVLR